MTAQVHEIIIVEGRELSMASCPDLPFGHPRFPWKNRKKDGQRLLKLLLGSPDNVDENREEIARLRTELFPSGCADVERACYDDEGDETSELFSTACGRGYQATWEITGGRFYLVGIRGQYSLIGDEPLLADWFTGELRIPEGKLIRYVHGGFGSTFEKETYTRIEQGLVVSSRVVDNLQAELADRRELEELSGTPDPAAVCERISISGAFFVQLIAWAHAHYEDVFKVCPVGNERVKRLLAKWEKVPGTRPDGTLDRSALEVWVGEAQKLAANGDDRLIRSVEFLIGMILAKSRYGGDGVWPHDAVREILERGSPSLLDGFRREATKGCDAELRTHDENEIRSVAAHYEAQAKTIESQYPRTSALLQHQAVTCSKLAELEHLLRSGA